MAEPPLSSPEVRGFQKTLIEVKVVTSYNVQENPLSVKISWTKPNENNEAITAYEILILSKDGSTWTEDPVNCKANTEPFLS